MKRKHLLIVAMATALCAVAPMTASAAGEQWRTGPSGWYLIDPEAGTANGYAQGWKLLNGVWYYFDEKTQIMATNFKQIDGAWYYFGTDGAMKTGFQQINGYWYYFGAGGDMYADRTEYINGTQYHFLSDGKMVAGWAQDAATGTWYHASDYGALTTGWWQNGAAHYYFDTATGAMYSNTTTTAVEGVLRHFVTDGRLVIDGWMYDNSTRNWYYADGSGRLYTGWVRDNSYWYYLDPVTGEMYYDTYGNNPVGDNLPGGRTYRFTESGQMITGWYHYQNDYDPYGSWVYCNADGTIYDKGWLEDDGHWYYINKTTGQWEPNSNQEGKYVDENSVLVGGWSQDWNGDWHYSDPATGNTYSGFAQSGDKLYFIDNSDMLDPWNDERSTYRYDLYDPYSFYVLGQRGAIFTIDLTPYNGDPSDAKDYVFNTDGSLVQGGWLGLTTRTGHTDWYYANADGTVYTGWVISGNKWFYVQNGVMLTNTWVDNVYWVGADGAWVQ